MADVTVGPLSIDVGEVTRAAKPFLPEDVGLDLEGVSQAHALTVGTIKVSGSIPKGVLTVLLNDLTLRVPTVNLKQKEMSISSGESSLSVNNLRLALKDLFPSQAVAAMSFHLNGLRVRGPKEVIVKRIDVPFLEVSALDIREKKEALFGVTGRIALKEAQSLGVLSVPKTTEIRNIQNNPSFVEISLRPAKSVDVDVKRTQGGSPFCFPSRTGSRIPTETPFSINTTMSIVLRKETEYEADIKAAEV